MDFLEVIRNFFNPTNTIQMVVVSSILLCFTSGVGLWLGQIKIGGKIALGGACVFFLGIILSSLGAKIDPAMGSFAQNFGLILFVYVLGVQVGPTFVSTFKTTGLKLNLWCIGLVLFGTLVATILILIGYDSTSNVVGLMTGAVTNAPALGAGQQSLILRLGFTPETQKMIEQMAIAMSIAYPLGAVGVILALEILKALFPKKRAIQALNAAKHYLGEYKVTNPYINGKTLEEIHKVHNLDYVISRIHRDGEVFIPTSDTKLQENDHLLVACNKDHKEKLTPIFGLMVESANQIDWYSIPTHENLVSRRILISKPGVNGKTLKDLKLRNKYGVNITRIIRADMELVPTPDLVLHFGDRLNAVGPEAKVKALASDLGDQLKRLDAPYLVSIFIGITLGLVLGAIPVVIPGTDIKVMLGLAGGPIVVGVLVGAYGTRMKMNTYITNSANLMLRTVGITLFFAGLGLSCGSGFFDSLLTMQGLSWVSVGVLVTLIPVLTLGILALKYTDQSYGTVGGWICGAMSNPIALDYLIASHEDNATTVSYATVYPMGMFMRVIMSQVLIMLLL